MNDALHAPAPAPARDAGGPTVRRTTSSELVKLRSLRSHVVLAATGLLFLLALGPVNALGQALAPDAAEPLTDLQDAMSLALNGGVTAALLAGILGVLSVTSEFPSGLVRTTFWAVPKRGLVVGGKALALTGVLVPVFLVGSGIATEASRLILTRVGSPLTWSEVGTWWAVVAMTFYVVGWGLLGQALGWLLRSAVGASFALLGVMWVLPMLVGLLPGAVSNAVMPFLLSQAGTSMLQVDGTGPGLLPPVAAVVWLVWIVGGLLVAAVAVRGRDA